MRPLINAAIDHLLQESQGTFRAVYFLTYTDKELSVCQDILEADPRLKADPVAKPRAPDLAAETWFQDACVGKAGLWRFRRRPLRA